MDNEEFIKLKNRFLIALLISLVFTIPFLFVIINKFGPKENKLLEELKENKDLVVLVTEDNCGECETVKKILKDKDVSYEELNHSENGKYEEILRRIDIHPSYISYPTIIYLEEGKLKSYLLIDDEIELNEYIEYNKLNELKR